MLMRHEIAPHSEAAAPEEKTFTGNRGLEIEEGLIFETGRPENTGVDLDEPLPFAHRLGSLERQEPARLPGLSEPETMRHYVRLSRLNYAIDAGIYPLGSCTMKHNPRLNEAMARLPGFADIHPLQPQSTVQGARQGIGRSHSRGFHGSQHGCRSRGLRGSLKFSFELNRHTMVSSREKIIAEVRAIYRDGLKIFLQEVNNVRPDGLPEGTKGAGKGPIHPDYQKWYTKSIRIIRALMPERLQEFVECYEQDKKRKHIDWLSYTIKDYLFGVAIHRIGQANLDTFSVFYQKMQHQINIIGCLVDIADQRVENIETIIQARLFDNQLDIASEMCRKGHLRAAGAIIGVVFEAHLKRIATNKSVNISKRNPTISDFNEALKSAEMIDTPVWRHIQRLGDIRNMCVHSKERDPTKDEIDDLLIGVKKYIAELN